MIPVLRPVRAATTSIFDSLLGIDTTSPEDMLTSHDTLHQDQTVYQSAHHLTILWFLRLMNLTKDDTLYDLGCGPGRVVCLAARQHLRRVVGVEIDPSLSALALANARALRGRQSPLEIVRGDAATTPYDDGTAFYMDNPFGLGTMRSVLDAIRASLETNPRRIRILYLHPLEIAAFDERPWLRFRSEHRFPLSVVSGTYWEAGPTV